MTKDTTILLRVIDPEFVRLLRERTGKKAGSKAFVEAAHRYLDQAEKIEKLERETLRLQHLLSSKMYIFQQLAPLCAQILEIASQGDYSE